jgi:hypothetical protein
MLLVLQLMARVDMLSNRSCDSCTLKPPELPPAGTERRHMACVHSDRRCADQSMRPCTDLHTCQQQPPWSKLIAINYQTGCLVHGVHWHMHLVDEEGLARPRLQAACRWEMQFVDEEGWHGHNCKLRAGEEGRTKLSALASRAKNANQRASHVRECCIMSHSSSPRAAHACHGRSSGAALSTSFCTPSRCGYTGPVKLACCTWPGGRANVR